MHCNISLLGCHTRKGVFWSAVLFSDIRKLPHICVLNPAHHHHHRCRVQSYLLSPLRRLLLVPPVLSQFTFISGYCGGGLSQPYTKSTTKCMAGREGAYSAGIGHRDLFKLPSVSDRGEGSNVMSVWSDSSSGQGWLMIRCTTGVVPLQEM